MTSVSDPTRFPAPTLPEIAFLGRSNVGKSSVINSLLGMKIAKTSNTPGRTQAINFFEVRWAGKPEPEVIFSDLPGYGYAKISREVSSKWPEFIEPYLRQRSTLVLCLALVDISIPTQQSDRLSNNELRNALLKRSREFSDAKILSYSARTGSGKDELWAEIRNVLAQ